MKTKNLIKNWLTGLGKGRGLDQLARFCNELAKAVALEKALLAQQRMLIPIEVHSSVQFRPRVKFLKPQLNSFKDSALSNAFSSQCAPGACRTV